MSRAETISADAWRIQVRKRDAKGEMRVISELQGPGLAVGSGMICFEVLALKYTLARDVNIELQERLAGKHRFRPFLQQIGDRRIAWDAAAPEIHHDQNSSSGPLSADSLDVFERVLRRVLRDDC